MVPIGIPGFPTGFDAATRGFGTASASDGLRAFSRQAFANAGGAFDRIARGAAAAQRLPPGPLGARAPSAVDLVGQAVAGGLATPNGQALLAALVEKGLTWLRAAAGIGAAVTADAGVAEQLVLPLV